MLNKLLLQSKNDIPFEQAQLIIKQPSINDIALIGESTFWTGCEYLNFSKEKLKQEDKIHLDSFSNFEILMTIIREDHIAIKQIKLCMMMVLSLMFPDYQITFLPMSILLTKITEEGKQQHFIDKDNFENFRNIVSKMFCLSVIQKEGPGGEYNPGGPQARALVKKFAERKKKLAKLKNQKKDNQEISILEQYVSILAVGEQKDKNELMQYTVSQLFDQLHRFRKKEDFDIYIKAKMAGAKDIKDVDNWMGSLSSDDLV